MEDSHAKMQDNGQKNPERESVAEAELYEEIRGPQAGDESRGSSASQSNGCCVREEQT